eukprot:EG_transcript_18600
MGCCAAISAIQPFDAAPGPPADGCPARWMDAGASALSSPPAPHRPLLSCAIVEGKLVQGTPGYKAWHTAPIPTVSNPLLSAVPWEVSEGDATTCADPAYQWPTSCRSAPPNRKSSSLYPPHVLSDMQSV